jgi:hypothetical protein
MLTITSVVISKNFHGAPESPPKPLLRTEQVAEKPHDSMGIRCVRSLCGDAGFSRLMML